MNSKHPGYDFAQEHGYTDIVSSSPGVNYGYGSTTYTCDDYPDIYLTITDDDQGELVRYFGFIKCSSGSFSIPNINFHIFENQILSLHSDLE